MALIRWSAARDPFQEWVDTAVAERHAAAQAAQRLSRPAARRPQRGAVVGYPPLNLYDGEDKVVCAMLAPGLEAESIDVSIDKDTLVIQAERAPDTAEGTTYIRSERPVGKLVRSISLPKDVDADAAEAEYANGVLSITVPKVEQAKPRKIQVRS